MAAVAQAQQVVAANAQESLSCVKSLLKLVRRRGARSAVRAGTRTARRRGSPGAG